MLEWRSRQSRLNRVPPGNYTAALSSDFSGTEAVMADRTASGGIGLTLGGAIVIAGIVIAIFWSWVAGVIVALIGLLAFGGFARGRWY